MQNSTLSVKVQNRVAFLALTRPERRNALDDVMIRELTETVQSLNRDVNVRNIVITGEGKAFCAGMDLGYLKKFSGMGEHENLEDARKLLQLLRSIQTIKKPVIAMVNGAALGGGCGLAAACDYVFASAEHARLGVPEVRIGFLPAVILFFLIRRMGEGAAREFTLQGGTMDARTACTRGLVTEVVPHDSLADRVASFAVGLCRTTSPSSVALTKDLFNRFSEMNLTDALEYAAHLNALSRKTDDFRKGLESFLRKESLEW